MSRRPQVLWEGLDYEHFRRVVHGAFQARRKTVLNSLRIAGGLTSETEILLGALQASEIDPGARAQQLAVDDFVRLAKTMA